MKSFFFYWMYEKFCEIHENEKKSKMHKDLFVIFNICKQMNIFETWGIKKEKIILEREKNIIIIINNGCAKKIIISIVF